MAREHSRDFKLDLCRRIKSGETTKGRACRDFTLSGGMIDRWMEQYAARGDRSFDGNPWRGILSVEAQDLESLQVENSRLRRDLDRFQEVCNELLRHRALSPSRQCPMFVGSAYGRRYVFGGLEAGPEHIAHLLDGLTPAEADFTPDPGRFTLREVVAHLADWEPVFLERMRRMVDEDDPAIPDLDEGQLAIDGDYGSRDWDVELARYALGRAANIEFLRELPEKAWCRQGTRSDGVPLSVEFYGVLMTHHDVYHARQVVEWRAAFRSV